MGEKKRDCFSVVDNEDKKRLCSRSWKRELDIF